MPDPLYSQYSRQGFDIIPSDTHPVQGPTQSDGRPLPYCRRILCKVSGNVTARFADDHANASVTFPVLAGVNYDYSLSYVYTTTTATLLGLV